MTGAEDTAGAAMEAATEAAVTMEGVRDVQLSGLSIRRRALKRREREKGASSPSAYGEAGGSLSVGMPAR